MLSFPPEQVAEEFNHVSQSRTYRPGLLSPSQEQDTVPKSPRTQCSRRQRSAPPENSMRHDACFSSFDIPLFDLSGNTGGNGATQRTLILLRVVCAYHPASSEPDAGNTLHRTQHSPQRSPYQRGHQRARHTHPLSRSALTLRQREL